MLASSRDSLATLAKALNQRASEANFASASAELLSVSTLLAGDKSLRVALADAGQPVEARQSLARDVFGSHIRGLALDLVVAAAGLRWSSADDLVEAIESLGAQVVFASADAEKTLDRVEEEIFHFARAVDANPELQMTLTNPALTSETKSAVVRDVIGGRAHAGTSQLLEYVAANLRGRRVDVALTTLSSLAASQRNRSVAQVRVAIALTDDQSKRLSAVLARLAGREVSLNVVIDPSVVGGVSVRLGDDVIDGSLSTRLEQARRALVG